MIIRERYLEKIRPFYDSEMIKVIMGVRRCGKSTLLRQIISEITESKNLDDDQILYLNFEDFSYSNLLYAQSFYEYVEPLILSEKMMYLFFDEIQNVERFELVINSFRATHDNVSIFITGSNTKLLSGELATHLGGRTISFRMLPFSFAEYVLVDKSALSSDELLARYIRYGGFPLVCNEHSYESKSVQLRNLYDSIVYKDVIRKNRYHSAITVESILNYLIVNSSITLSPKKIVSELKKEGIEITIPTLYEYLNRFQESGLIQMIPRYDIRGKRMLSFQEKAYVCDLGLFSMLKNRIKDELSYITETIVFNELISRAFTVYIGKTYKGEVDFIAERPDGWRCYIQVAYLMVTEDTKNREFRAFYSIHDNHPKFVISQDPICIDRDGIHHLRLIDFLMHPELLTG